MKSGMIFFNPALLKKDNRKREDLSISDNISTKGCLTSQTVT